jgi:hypothetical protein
VASGVPIGTTSAPAGGLESEATTAPLGDAGFESQLAMTAAKPSSEPSRTADTPDHVPLKALIRGSPELRVGMVPEIRKALAGERRSIEEKETGV